METNKKPSNKFSPEVRARAVRMVREHRGDHASQWAAIASIAAKIGCSGETLRNWVRQAFRPARSERLFQCAIAISQVDVATTD